MVPPARKTRAPGWLPGRCGAPRSTDRIFWKFPSLLKARQQPGFVVSAWRPKGLRSVPGTGLPRPCAPAGCGPWNGPVSGDAAVRAQGAAC